MVTKKNQNSDLEKTRPLFLQIGFIFALAVTLIAFEWPSSDQSGRYSYQATETVDVYDLVPITTHEQKTLPAPPKPVNQINIVDDYTDLNETLEIPSSEIGEDYAWNATIYEPAPDPREDVHTHVEIMPSFPGGEQALMRFLANSIKYPQDALRGNVFGRVYVRFIVDRDGNISNVEILRGVHPSLNQEAIRVIKSMPRWEPGIQNGVPVNVQYVIPVNFRISYS